MHAHEKRKRLDDLQKKLIPELKLNIAAAQKGVAVIQKELSAYEREERVLFAALTPKGSDEPTISDHALVRYLERSKGFDLDVFRKEILTDERISAIKAGANTVSCNGVKFKISNNVIVTVV